MNFKLMSIFLPLWVGSIAAAIFCWAVGSLGYFNLGWAAFNTVGVIASYFIDNRKAA